MLEPSGRPHPHPDASAAAGPEPSAASPPEAPGSAAEASGSAAAGSAKRASGRPVGGATLRTEKVFALRTALANGTYKIDARRIAKRLLGRP